MRGRAPGPPRAYRGSAAHGGRAAATDGKTRMVGHRARHYQPGARSTPGTWRPAARGVRSPWRQPPAVGVGLQARVKGQTVEDGGIVRHHQQRARILQLLLQRRARPGRGGGTQPGARNAWWYSASATGGRRSPKPIAWKYPAGTPGNTSPGSGAKPKRA